MIVLKFYPTDIAFLGLVLAGLMIGFLSRKAHMWQQIKAVLDRQHVAYISAFVLMAYISVAALDSIHFKTNLFKEVSPTKTLSVLDAILYPLGQQDEKTYAKPFSLYLLSAKNQENPEKRLQYAGQHLKQGQSTFKDLTIRFAGISLISIIVLFGLISLSWRKKRLWCLLVSVLWCILVLKFVAPHYHILGTDKVGQDVLYQTIKSIRTALVIGTLSTLFMLPFAVFLGLSAGYFGRRLDDIIQYIYTVVSSVPGVLLISAVVLSLQIVMYHHAVFFSTSELRADVRMLALCFILGVTGWVGLCRVLRAETLKLRELEYIQAAKAMGVGHFNILMHHILPNVLHLVFIAVVLDFSGLVLAEAVLSYIGVGVDPTSYSWGNMINSARLELARAPVVWWPLFSAFLFMFVLVLAVNILSDAIRDALDPRVS